MDKVKLAKLVLTQMEAIKGNQANVSDLLTLINEVLRDAKQLAEETLKEDKIAVDKKQAA